jgi:hypothetical protein
VCTEPGARRGACRVVSVECAVTKLKLARAQHHLKKVDKAIARWISDSHESITEEPNPECSGEYGSWIDPPELPIDRLGLLIGDCLQCYRTTLDHLAFELATAHTQPLPNHLARSSEFPILDDEGETGSTRFHSRLTKPKGKRKAGDPERGSGLAKIEGIGLPAQAEIERSQPYHRGHAYKDDPLWRLHELNRLDKHRLLHVVGVVIVGMGFNARRWENIAMMKDGGGMIGFMGVGPLKGRTQIARWNLEMIPIDPAKEMRVNFRVPLGVAFDSATPVVGGLPVLDVLTEMDNHIVSEVLPPLVGFLK